MNLADVEREIHPSVYLFQHFLRARPGRKFQALKHVHLNFFVLVVEVDEDRLDHVVQDA